MNIAVLGSGGREHSICFALKKSKKIKRLFCIPGNAGTASIAKNINIDISDFEKINTVVTKNKIDLIIVGPEQPLVDGIVDYFKKKNIKIFGPEKFAAQLEGSKYFTKIICKENNIPTAKFGFFDDYLLAQKFINRLSVPIVVKADGLASGKGVYICDTKNKALKATKKIISGKFKSSSKVLLEEYLDGEEMSYFIIADKNNYKYFGSAQDHKRVGKNDIGPNTGGMGAYSPSAIINKNLEKKIIKKIIEPTLLYFKKKGHSYKGFLYAGLMIVKNEPFLIEYNVRMGDPECQTILTRLNTDFLEIINATLTNKLSSLNIMWKKQKSICIVVCANGYPKKYKKNDEIKKLKNLNLKKNNFIFHAGTYIKDNKIFSNGGRVFNALSVSNKLLNARKKTLNLIKKIGWKKGFYRNDIGWRVINKKK